MKLYEISEAWSKKYKDSINCSNPKGFSQKAHCAGKKKNEDVTKGNFGGVVYPRLPHEEVLDAISSWEYGDTPIELSNGYVINAREEGYNDDDNAWVLLDPQGKIVDHGEGSIEGVMQGFAPIQIDENFDDNDIVEYYDEIHPVVISAWKSVYPNVPLKAIDNEDLYMQYTTADEYLPHGGNGKDIYLSLGVQYIGDEEPPMGYINVGDAYAGNYKGVVAKIIADLFEWLEKKHPNIGVRELGIHMNRNTEAWNAIAQKVGAQLEKRGYYENFADGKKKGKSRPGRVKKAGASCKGSVSSLRAKAKKYSGERGKMYHWCANMKGGKKNKTNESVFDNLQLPTWMSHTSLEKMFTQEYGQRAGEYLMYMDLDSDDDLAMSSSMGQMALEIAKEHDIKEINKFFSHFPVNFHATDLKLNDGIQVWKLEQNQQPTTIH